MDCLKMAKNLGAHALVLKPFNREQLVATVGLVFPPDGP